jgi:hypothetical protein
MSKPTADWESQSPYHKLRDKYQGSVSGKGRTFVFATTKSHSTRVKWPHREDGHSPTRSGQVLNVSSDISTHPLQSQEEVLRHMSLVTEVT